MKVVHESGADDHLLLATKSLYKCSKVCVCFNSVKAQFLELDSGKVCTIAKVVTAMKMIISLLEAGKSTVRS